MLIETGQTYTKQGRPEKWSWGSAAKISEAARTGCMRIGYHWRVVESQLLDIKEVI